MSAEAVIETAASRSGWPIAPIWSIAKRVERTGFPDAELLSVYRDWGVVRKSDRDDNFNVESDDLSSYKYVQPGNLVLNKMKTWQGSLAVSDYEGIVSPAYFTCELSPDVHPRFIHYLLRSDLYVAMYAAASKGIRPNQWDLPYDEFRGMPVLLPPVEEQRRIADFLDDQVTCIDAIEARRSRQVELLHDLEVAALEAILWPTHAPSSELRRFGTSVTTGPFGTAFSAEEYVSGGVPMVNPTHVREGRIWPDSEHSVSPETARRLIRHQLRSGDIVTGRKGDLGRSALVGHEQDGWICGSDAMAIHVNHAYLNPNYLEAILHLPGIRRDLISQSPGATMPSLNEGMLLGLRIPNIGLEEQHRRAEQAALIRARHAGAREVLVASMTALTNLKQSFITAAVTGELDVTTARRGVPV